MSVEAFSEEAAREFTRRILGGDGVQFLALDNDQVVGWCDVVRLRFEGFHHCGTLGMGLLPDYRNQGLGSRLLGAVLDALPATGISRIELEVLASNEAGIALYKKFGFVEEGRKRRARKLDGAVDDLVCMALLT